MARPREFPALRAPGKYAIFRAKLRNFAHKMRDQKMRENDQTQPGPAHPRMRTYAFCTRRRIK